jgi:hypothetical protein
MPRASVMRCPRSGLMARLSWVRISALTGPGLGGTFPGRNPHPTLKAIPRSASAPSADQQLRRETTNER